MKDKLKLIKSPDKLKSPNNFWRACPRSLEFLPETPCDQGKPKTTKSGRVQEEPKCPFWINSEDHNYCFWTYVYDKSNPDGVMPELVQSDLAHLFGWSNTKTHFALKEAIKELTEALVKYGGFDLSDSDSDDFNLHLNLPELQQYDDSSE